MSVFFRTCLSLHISLFNSLSLHLLGFVSLLQEANDTLKAEVKRLKEVADEKERDTERFKVNECRVEMKWRDGKESITDAFVFHCCNCFQAQIRDQGYCLDESK